MRLCYSMRYAALLVLFLLGPAPPSLAAETRPGSASSPGDWLSLYRGLAAAAPATCPAVQIPELPPGMPAAAFPILDLPAIRGPLVVHNEDPIVERFLVLAQGADGCVVVGASGRALPFAARSVRSHLANTLIPGELGPAPPVAIIADFKGIRPWVRVSPEAEFRDNAAQAWVLLGGYTGMLCILLAVGIGFWVSQRNRLSAAYVLYVGTLQFYQLQAFGLGFAWLPFWPGPEHARLMQGLSVAVLLLGTATVVVTFLQASRRFRAVFLGLVAVGMATFLLSAWSSNAYRAGSVFVLTVAVMTAGMLLGRLARRDWANRWFALGLGATVIGGGVQSLSMLHAEALPGIAGLAVPIGNLLESICWLIALATRIHGERLAMQERLRHEATHDSLTGIYGRSFLRRAIQQAIAEAEEAPRRPCGLLFVDLDGFKHINDSLGHAMGDKVLTAVAKALVDLKLDSQAIGRFGGDEYLVLIRRGAHWSVTEGAAAAVVGRFRDPVEVQGRPISIAASVGVVPITTDYRHADQVVHDADTALYVAKARGGGRYVLFEPHMREDADERARMRRDLVLAMRGGQIELHYQPVFQLEPMRPIGFEALIRWQRPGVGVLDAATFLPLAEELGLMRELGGCVIELALRQVAAWQQAGLWHPGQYVSINVGAQQLADETLFEQLDLAFVHHAVDPSSIRVEICEGALAGDPDMARRAAARLLGLNVLIAVDDFGRGLLPLGLLNELQFDQIKVDASVVAGVAHLARSQGIARSALALGEELACLVVAEGVDDRQQLAMLQTLGYAYGQGNLFAAPMPATEVALWVDLWQGSEAAISLPQEQRRVH